VHELDVLTLQGNLLTLQPVQTGNFIPVCSVNFSISSALRIDHVPKEFSETTHELPELSSTHDCQPALLLTSPEKKILFYQQL
jgi:hypothetical protein